jgi:general secretion pathway protein C
LDRARLERATSERAPPEPLRFDTSPPPQLSYLQLAEAPAGVEPSADDHTESPPLPEPADPLDALSADSDRAVYETEAVQEPKAIHEPHAVEEPDAVPEPDESHLQAVRDESPTASSEVPPNPTQGIDLDSSIAPPTQTELVDWENPQAAAQGESSPVDRLWGLRGSHPSSYAPLVVSLILGILIAADLARASRLLLFATPPMAQAPSPVGSGRPSQRAVFDVHDIVAAHLFGEAADPGTQDPANAPQTTANLLLAGTLAGENPRHGIAIISTDGRSTLYRVGDTVADGELHSVYRDHVVLRRHGIFESLVFPKLRLARTSDGTPSPAAASSAGPAPRADPTAQAASAKPSAGDEVRGAASASPDGKLRGFRIFPNGNPKLFADSGVRPGDLVVAVNGASLEGQDRKTGQEIFDSLKTSSQATLTVMDRAGARRDITLNSSIPDPADQ